jgi:hypothetical protein
MVENDGDEGFVRYVSHDLAPRLRYGGLNWIGESLGPDDFGFRDLATEVLGKTLGKVFGRNLPPALDAAQVASVSANSRRHRLEGLPVTKTSVFQRGVLAGIHACPLSRINVWAQIVTGNPRHLLDLNDFLVGDSSELGPLLHGLWRHAYGTGESRLAASDAYCFFDWGFHFDPPVRNYK